MQEMPRAISRDELIGGRTDNFVPHPSAPQFRPSRRQCGRIEPRRTPPRLVLIKERRSKSLNSEPSSEILRRADRARASFSTPAGRRGGARERECSF